MSTAENLYRITFDEIQTVDVYGDGLEDVLDFIAANQRALFGHEGVHNLSIDIKHIKDEEASFIDKQIAEQIRTFIKSEELDGYLINKPIDLDAHLEPSNNVLNLFDYTKRD